MATKTKLGQAVTYISTKGKQKLAFVTATPETVMEGTSLPTLSEGQLHLTVISPSSGKTYARHSVPSEESVKGNTEFENEEGTAVGVWRK